MDSFFPYRNNTVGYPGCDEMLTINFLFSLYIVHKSRLSINKLISAIKIPRIVATTKLANEKHMYDKKAKC